MGKEIFIPVAKNMSLRGRISGFEFSCVTLGKSFNLFNLVCSCVKSGREAGDGGTCL
jgi:hypothetical protein